MSPVRPPPPRQQRAPRGLRRAAPVPAHAAFVPIGGGRSNRIWRITAQDAPPLIGKLYDPGRRSALFPNDPIAEARALRALAGTGLAPRFVAADETEDGPALFYEYLPGAPWSGDFAAAARLLARLHRCAPPAGLRRLPGGARAIAAQSGAFIAELAPAQAARLGRLRPLSEVAPARRFAFLHGDPVPANIVETAGGPALIDWQCPALGDACEDLAVFLSPAMQALYGGAAPAARDVAAFLAAYGASDVATRYRLLAPHYHWRMAAYCLWMAQRGEADYAAAAALELEALKRP